MKFKVAMYSTYILNPRYNQQRHEMGAHVQLNRFFLDEIS